jgi:ribonuclease D
MDYDDLYHLLNIRLSNVHDTAIWHSLITGRDSPGLNELLWQHNCCRNVARDTSVYDTNHAFWATRPLTDYMILWAAGDVASLLTVYNNHIDAHQVLKSEADRRVSELAAYFETCKVAVVQVQDKGSFIGLSGSNRRIPEGATQTFIYQCGYRSGNEFTVYYMDASSLEAVKNLAGTR